MGSSSLVDTFATRLSAQPLIHRSAWNRNSANFACSALVPGVESLYAQAPREGAKRTWWIEEELATSTRRPPALPKPSLSPTGSSTLRQQSRGRSEEHTSEL